jgi:hypothetical protein
MVIFLGIFKVADLFQFELTESTQKNVWAGFGRIWARPCWAGPSSIPRRQEKKKWNLTSGLH